MYVRQNIEFQSIPERLKQTFHHDFNSNVSKNVVLEIDKKCLSDVEEWLGIENVKEISGKHIASVNLPFDEGLVTKIMGFGDGIKVLEPTELKLKIKDVCLSIINNY